MTHVSENPYLTEDNGDWVLVLERMLDHSREGVWDALTKVDEIPNWAPFMTDRDVTVTGAVKLAHINMSKKR